MYKYFQCHYQNICEIETYFKSRTKRIGESGSAPVQIRRKGLIKFTHHSQNGKLIQTKEKN